MEGNATANGGRVMTTNESITVGMVVKVDGLKGCGTVRRIYRAAGHSPRFVEVWAYTRAGRLVVKTATEDTVTPATPDQIKQ